MNISYKVHNVEQSRIAAGSSKWMRQWVIENKIKVYKKTGLKGREDQAM